jgi:hypothetical protein
MATHKLRQKWVRLQIGDFFTNSSGHPVVNVEGSAFVRKKSCQAVMPNETWKRKKGRNLDFKFGSRAPFCFEKRR